ncbi:hypothetical protein [Nocardia ignorata]|uniref:DUF8020 domain-containing protein n=1 Tax=Nocardia ignorata TaxID=145285 RepID=A0A4R6PSI7_NOCIG|nr:hypothetical protein [Nocardia ignorata]TDP40970.1 hypothetical protein DFR75_10168 [Nocardia ignorata]
MKFTQLLAAGLFTVAATGITAATAHGAPVAGPSLAGVDGAVAYSAALASDGSEATVELTSGTFELAPGAGVAVLSPDGARVGFIPTTVAMVAGPAVQVIPEIDASATSLTLTPVNAPAPNPAALQHIDQTGNIVAGVAIGCVVGALIGLIFLLVSAIPGCIIGAVIGGVIGANQ